MGVQEVKNSQFAPEKTEEKRRRKRVRRAIEPSPIEEPPSTPMKTSSFIEQATNHQHSIYKDFLRNRKNGDRLYSVNFLR